MAKFFLRIVAFLLIPCLISDPAIASYIHAPYSSGLLVLSAQSRETKYRQEALAVRTWPGSAWLIGSSVRGGLKSLFNVVQSVPSLNLSSHNLRWSERGAIARRDTIPVLLSLASLAGGVWLSIAGVSPYAWFGGIVVAGLMPFLVRLAGRLRSGASINRRHGFQRAAILAVSVVVIALTVAYGTFRVSESGFSFRYALEMPSPMPQIEMVQGKWISDGKVISVPSANTLGVGQIDRIINDGMANRIFWQQFTTSLPRNVPVTSILTLERIQNLWQTNQLDSLFNGLRSRPEVLYRYLSEILESQALEFSRYFATMKPGTRQKVFEIFYHRLRNDLEVQENAGWLKRTVFPSKYLAALRQASRMSYLYGVMAQTLNRTSSGTVDHALPAQPVAPFPMLSFTESQAIDNYTRLFQTSIATYQQRGYKVVLPNPRMLNSGEVVGLMGYPNDLDKANFFLDDNRAALLLQWVLETSKPGPNGHLVDDTEIFNKAMELHSNSQTKTIDLFKVLATIGHYYKGMARDPDLILGGPEARTTTTGVRFILDHHDRLSLIWSLDPDNRYTVDDTGRPVLRWRPVDADGNDRIPQGEVIGIVWPSIEADLYHSWNYWLTAFYVRQKTFSELNQDWNTFYRTHPKVMRESTAGLGDPPWVATIAQVTRAFGIWQDNQYQVKQDALLALKLSDVFGLHDFVVMQTRFSLAGAGRSKERTKIVMAYAEERLNKSLIKTGQIGLIGTDEHLILNDPDTRTVEGGRLTAQYRDAIVDEWKSLNKPNAVEWARRDPRRFWQVMTALEQIENLEHHASDNLPYHTRDIEAMATAGRFDANRFEQFGPLEWKRRIAGKSASTELLATLSHDADGEVRLAVAGNKAAFGDTLARLASDKDSSIRKAVALNPSTPGSTLAELTKDSRQDTPFAAVRNPSMPSNVLRELVNSPNPRIRENVAANVSCPSDILSRLSTDSDANVRAETASNPSTPIAALVNLSLDHDSYVREKLGGNGLSVHGNSKAPLAALIEIAVLKQTTDMTREYLEDLIRKKYGQLGETIRQSIKTDMKIQKLSQIDRRDLAKLANAETLFLRATTTANKSWDEIKSTGDVSRDIESVISVVGKDVGGVASMFLSNSPSPLPAASYTSKRKLKGEQHLKGAA